MCAPRDLAVADACTDRTRVDDRAWGRTRGAGPNRSLQRGASGRVQWYDATRPSRHSSRTWTDPSHGGGHLPRVTAASRRVGAISGSPHVGSPHEAESGIPGGEGAAGGSRRQPEPRQRRHPRRHDPHRGEHLRPRRPGRRGLRRPRLLGRPGRGRGLAGVQGRAAAALPDLPEQRPAHPRVAHVHGGVGRSIHRGDASEPVGSVRRPRRRGWRGLAPGHDRCRPAGVKPPGGPRRHGPGDLPGGAARPHHHHGDHLGHFPRGRRDLRTRQGDHLASGRRGLAA